MKRGDVKKNVFPRLKGMSLVGMMLLALTSGAVVGAEETKGFHLYRAELVEGKPVELEGFIGRERSGPISALRATKDAPFKEFAKDHLSNPRKTVEAIHGALRAEFSALKKDSSIEKDQLISKLKDFSKALIGRFEKLDKGLFGDEAKKEAFLKLINRIPKMSDEDLKKLATGELSVSLEEFLRRIFEGAEGEDKEEIAALLKTLGVSVTKPEEKKPAVAENDKPKDEPKADDKNRFQRESVPGLGGNPNTPNPNDNPPYQPPVGEQNIDALAEKMCQDILDREQSQMDKFLAALKDLRDRFRPREEERQQQQNQPAPEEGLLKALQNLLGQEEQPQQVAESTPPQAPVQPPQQEERRNNQIPQPPLPQQGGMPMMPFNSQAASAVPAVDATPAKAPNTGKSALSKATTVAESVKPVSEMEPPVAAQVVQPNPSLSPQANAQNVETYYAQAAQYVDSYRRSIGAGLNMVREEKRNLAKSKQQLADEIDSQLEKQLPDDIKQAEQVAQQELDQAKQELKQAEQQAAMMMSQVDPANAGAAQAAASQTVAQANNKIAQAQQRAQQLAQVKKDWKANQGRIDSTLKSRMERMEQAETELATRENALNERLKDVQNIAQTNERNKQQSLALVNSMANQNQFGSNVNLISGANLNNNSRRGNGLGGAVNQGNRGGSRAPLAGTF